MQTHLKKFRLIKKSNDKNHIGIQNINTTNYVIKKQLK